jgi:ferredoxin-thioredoxin reductase catalytic subunit
MNQWTSHPAKYKAALRRIKTIAAKHGCVLNSDKERVEKVIGLMTENYVAAGKYYCPCKQSDPLDADKDVVCPCPEWKEEVAKNGHCFCRLFYEK